MKKLILNALLLIAHSSIFGQKIPGTPAFANEYSTEKVASGGMLYPFLELDLPGLKYTTSTLQLTQRYYNELGAILPADFTVSGLPCFETGNNSVLAAFLYYIIEGDTVDYDFTIKDPNGVTTVVSPNSMWFEFSGKCWTCLGNYHYRADVTDLIVGDGIYTIDGLPQYDTASNQSIWCQPGDTDGATLVIIYMEPNVSYLGHISLWDGNYLTNNGGIMTYNLPMTPACDFVNNAKVFGAYGDIQDNTPPPQVVYLNTINDTVDPNFYNYQEHYTSIYQGQDSVRFGLDPNQDCISQIFGGLYYQTTTCQTFNPLNCAQIDSVRNGVLTELAEAEKAKAEKLMLYPNPVRLNAPIYFDWMQIKPDPLNIQIFGMDGKLVQEHILYPKPGASKIEIPDGANVPGLYFVRLIQGSVIKTSKLLVQ